MDASLTTIPPLGREALPEYLRLQVYHIPWIRALYFGRRRSLEGRVTYGRIHRALPDRSINAVAPCDFTNSNLL